MNRFFLSKDQISKNEVTFPADIAHQIRRVLRLEEGDQVAVLDNEGHLYLVSLQISHDGERVSGAILSAEDVTTEPETQVSLCFGLSSREKVEFILQKGTEIGLASFYPFISSRTLVQYNGLSEQKRERWERIIREAAEQSCRGLLPILHSPTKFNDCLDLARQDHRLCILAWEKAEPGQLDLDRLVRKQNIGKIALFIGPEGGFSEEEVMAAKDRDYQIISLGKRILRMETAAIVLPALVLHAAGDS